MSPFLTLYTNPEKAILLAKFFQTHPGGYGEGDKFLGVSVPDIRKVAKQNTHLSLKEIEPLIESKFHEERLLALLILTYQFPKASFEKQKQIVNFYLKNTDKINNWDLVDSSAHKILGEWLLKEENRDKLKILDELSKSKNMWEQRISIISTFAFINKYKFEPSLKLAKGFLSHKHDLMHKAVGWVLREIWKKDADLVEEFLKENYNEIPRTSLRYAIERMDEVKRKKFLNRDF
jgi:3-methyladenine DNA glycosylase AlkD